MWAIHNPIKSWTLFDVSQAELEKIVVTLSDNERRLCQVAQKGALGWIPLADLVLDLNSVLLPKEGYPELNTDSTDQSDDSAYFIFRPKKAFHQRTHKRYEVALPCIIENHLNAFKTQTIDISEGGIYFTDTIPEWVSGYFVVKIETQHESFQLICSLVEDQKVKQRVQIMSEDTDIQFVKFKTWLKSLN